MVGDDVVQVPSTAITRDGATSTVVVATDGTLDGPTETRTIETGGTTGMQVEVVSGLEPGEQVVVEVPSFAARAGGGGASIELPEGFTPGDLPAGGPGGGPMVMNGSGPGASGSEDGQ